jgi:hypothetical protein
MSTVRELQLSQLAALALRVHQGFFESTSYLSVPMDQERRFHSQARVMGATCA